jgi:hypothetical protein
LPLTYKLNLLTFILPSRAYFAYPATTFGLPGDHFRPTRQSPLGLPGDHLRPTRRSPPAYPAESDFRFRLYLLYFVQQPCTTASSCRRVGEDVVASCSRFSKGGDEITSYRSRLGRARDVGLDLYYRFGSGYVVAYSRGRCLNWPMSLSQR